MAGRPRATRWSGWCSRRALRSRDRRLGPRCATSTRCSRTWPCGRTGQYVYRRAYARMLVLVSRMYERYQGADNYFWHAQKLVHETTRKHEPIRDHDRLTDIDEVGDVDVRYSPAGSR